MIVHTNLNVQCTYKPDFPFHFYFLQSIQNCTFNKLCIAQLYNISDGLLSLQNYFYFVTTTKKKITYHKNHQRKNSYIF